MHSIVWLFMVILSTISRRAFGFRFFSSGKNILSSSKSIVSTTKASMSTTTSSVETCAVPTPPVEVFRRDYTPAPYFTSDIHLSFKISPGM